MNALWNWLVGKRTYIIAIITAVFSVLAAFGIVVPEWVYGLLAAVGLGTLRAAVK